MEERQAESPMSKSGSVFVPVTLEGEHVRLEPLALHHESDLAAAAGDGEIWRLWYTSVPEPDRMRQDIERRLGLQAAGSSLPFAIVDRATSRAVGTTNFMNIDQTNVRVEIGGTWHARSVQRSPINTEAKKLLLTHAFEVLGCIAVELRTHFMNHASRRAIERLGAKQDGILRNHIRANDGTLRDTCVYSITEAEWPTVRSHLRWLMEKPRG